MERLSADHSSDEGHVGSAGEILQFKLASEAVERLNSEQMILAKSMIKLSRSKNFTFHIKEDMSLYRS
jgi:hypothetical protein